MSNRSERPYYSEIFIAARFIGDSNPISELIDQLRDTNPNFKGASSESVSEFGPGKYAFWFSSKQDQEIFEKAIESSGINYERKYLLSYYYLSRDDAHKVTDLIWEMDRKNGWELTAFSQYSAGEINAISAKNPLGERKIKAVIARLGIQHRVDDMSPEDFDKIRAEQKTRSGQ